MAGIRPALGVFLTLLALGCGGGAPETPRAATQPKGPGSPEDAVKLLAIAARAGDVDKVLAQLTPALARTKKTMLEIGSEEIVFATVLDSKFGQDITPIQRYFPSTGEWREGLKGFRRIEVRDKQVVRPDRVLLTVWEESSQTVETRVMALQIAGGWKLDYQRVLGDRPARPATRTAADGKSVTVQVEEVPEWTEADPKAVDAYLNALERYRNALGQISKDVSTGQYPSREAADTARRLAAKTAFAGLAR